MESPEREEKTGAEVCYRHTDRPAGVSCQRCGRIICSECMNPASVGVHCPECVKGTAQRVYTPDTMPGARALVTRTLIAINLTVFAVAIATLGSTFQRAGEAGVDYGTWGPRIAEEGEWWRVISGGFLHSGVLHIAFNMYLLFQLGQRLERDLGERKFLLAYFVSLIGGSFGAILLQPSVPVVGASGAVFGLIGVTIFSLRSRGIGLFQTSLGMLVVINVFLSFRSGVSLGGHAGGLLVGLIIGVLFFGLNPGDGPLFGKNRTIPAAVTGLLGVALFVGALWAATTWNSPIF